MSKQHRTSDTMVYVSKSLPWIANGCTVAIRAKNHNHARMLFVKYHGEVVDILKELRLATEEEASRVGDYDGLVFLT